jgi:single-stranded-DNA-specific exonuclease
MLGPSPWKSRRLESAPPELESRFGSLLGSVLWARGYSTETEVDAFLNPKLESLRSPFSLHNMKESAERLATGITNGESIAVYADYDMDGMSALALLKSFFALLTDESKVLTHQPDRLAEGYGVHPAALTELKAKGVSVVVTVDTGIAAFEAAQVAREMGVDLIITDHHKQISESVPDTPFVVNPNQRLDQSGLRYLSGVGVAFYLAVAVRATLRSRGFFASRPEPDLRALLDFFVLGTVADSVQLVGDNRVLVRVGLRQLVKTQREGLRVLLDRVTPGAAFLSTRDVGFSITPKLNAASRMGQAALATELLLCTSKDRANELADKILELNGQRSQIQSQVFEEALSQAEAQILESDPPVLVVHGDWHEGVLGVVAAKLVERLGRPSVVMTKVSDLGLLRGSMRTRAPVSCVKALDACKDWLLRYGGHTMAAGLQMSPDSVKDFSKNIWTSTRKFIEELDELAPVEFDGDLDFSKVNPQSVEQLEATSPWGEGNSEPLFRIKNVDISQMQTLKGQHLKCQISSGLSLIGFFKAADIEKLKTAGARHFDALVTPEINRFRNQKTVQLRLQYARPSDTAAARAGSGPGLSRTV